MFILDWYKQWLDIRSEFADRKRERQVCESCEVLSTQLAAANREKEMLLSRLLEEPAPVVEEIKPNPNLTLLKPQSHLPWKARRELLIKEDRHQAKLRDDKAKEKTAASGTALTIQEMEKELGVTEDAAK